MKWKTVSLLIVLIPLTACVNAGAATNCTGWAAIRPDSASLDGMTAGLAVQIEAHNEYGLARGCWR